MDSTNGQALTWAFLAYGIIAGIIVAEGMRAALVLIEVPRRLSQLQVTLSAFQAAEDDDARQRLILRAGVSTLTLSLLLFTALLVACVVMSLPLPWVEVTGATLAAYMTLLSVAAILWWRLRRAPR